MSQKIKKTLAVSLFCLFVVGYLFYVFYPRKILSSTDIDSFSIDVFDPFSEKDVDMYIVTDDKNTIEAIEGAKVIKDSETFISLKELLSDARLGQDPSTVISNSFILSHLLKSDAMAHNTTIMNIAFAKEGSYDGVSLFNGGYCQKDNKLYTIDAELFEDILELLQ